MPTARAIRSRFRFAAPLLALLAAILPASALGASHTDGSTAAPAPVLKAVRTVPAATLDAVSLGAFSSGIALQWLGAQAARPGQRATVLTENAAWCPHCAANS